MKKYDRLRANLGNMAHGSNTSCQDFTALLRKLGFDIKDGGSPGHKIVTHAGICLKPADAANYNCGHNPGTHIKRPYIKKFLHICDDYEEELRGWLK